MTDHRIIYYREIVWRKTGRTVILKSAVKMAVGVVLFLGVVYGIRPVRGDEPIITVGPAGGAVVIVLG
jgi:uncharacterized membrane protein YgdD (TMEM256/DUF423 family)